MAEQKQNSILEGLNDAQRRAVSAVTGPLLIVAGAGTGKTRVITARILHLLTELKVPADQILALTFTEKAATEMLTRVDEAMPLSYEEVTIKTFHGFCDMILRERGIEIGIDPGFKLVSEPEQWIFIRNNLFKFNLNYFRPLGNPNKFIHVLLKHFSRLKDEDISPEDYLANAELKLKGFEGKAGASSDEGVATYEVGTTSEVREGVGASEPTSEVGTTSEVGSEAEREELEKDLELARAYKTYQDLMKEKSYLDFGDLQYYALRLVEGRKSLLKLFGERYKYILVDEFQDTNFAQNKLVMMLAGVCGNITVVGDDDQSIYKWRGASLTNIKSFEKTFLGAKLEILTENYRSRQEILDVSYHVIQSNNPDRLEVKQNISKKLVAKGGFESVGANAELPTYEVGMTSEVGAGSRAELPTYEVGTTSEVGAGSRAELPTYEVGMTSEVGAVNCYHFKHYQDEVRFITDAIKNIVSEGKAGYGDIAVLVRTNQLASPFIDSFKDVGIPFNVRDSLGLLMYPEIKDLTSLLRFVANPHDDVAVFRLLSLNLFGIEMSQLLDLVARAKRAAHTPLFYFLEMELKEDETKSAMVLPGMEEIAGDSGRDATNGSKGGFETGIAPFKNPFLILKELLECSRGQSVNRLIGEFLDKTGYYKSLTADDSYENAEKIQHIGQFIDISARFEVEGNDKSARMFLDFLDSYSQAQNGLKVENVFDDNSVSVLTVHSSKGLEFDYVFLPSLVANRFPGINRRDPVSIPPELLEEELPLKEAHLQEERRLFYVACTRARKVLNLSYSDAYEGAKKWKISPFLVEAVGSGLVKEHEMGLMPSMVGAVLDGSVGETVDGTLMEAVTVVTDGVKTPIAKSIDEGESNRLREYIPEVNIHQLSYSKINSFKECPLRYKFQYHFKIRTPQGHATAFGSSVHNTVNDFYQFVGRGEEPTMELLNKLFENNWIMDGYESASHEKERKKFGLEVMKRFFETEEKRGFAVPAFLEKPFRIRAGKYTFTGRIDRIDKLEDGTYEIIDYKTGKSKKESDLKKDLQLSLYALAGRDFFKIPVSKLSLYFIEDGEKVSTVRDSALLDSIRDELEGVAKELAYSSFEATPDQFKCGWCAYRTICNSAKV